MKIMCSGDLYKEPIEHTECLDCAIRMQGEQPCHMSYPLLKSIYGSWDADTRRIEFHVTDINACLLKAYLGKVDPMPEYPHEMLVVFVGKAVHDYIDKFLDEDEHFRSEVPVTGDVVGRVDAVGQETIIDYKTTRWMRPEKLPYGSHGTQVNIYRHILTQMGEDIKKLQIQYIDVTGPTKCRSCHSAYRLIDGEYVCNCGRVPASAHLGAFLVPIPIMDSEELTKSVQIRAFILRDAIETKTPPEAEPSWLCDYCAFTQCNYHPRWRNV